MAAGLDPNDIHGFLRSYGRENNTSGHGGGVFHPGHGGSVFSPSASTPRQISYSNALGEGSEYSYSHGSQNYTASNASTRTCTKGAPSVFSYRTTDRRSSVGSAPSVGVNQQTFDQYAAAGPQPQQGAGDLWCEFDVLMDCKATFRLDDTQSWINHHIDHLGDRLPAKSTCWFCDDIRFTADKPVDEYTKLMERMDHIYSHILYDDRLTSRNMRPDFHVLKHLYKTGLISKETYDYATNYSELPRKLRLPVPSIAASSSSSRRQPEPLDRVQPYDYEKQERRERRHQEQMKKERSDAQERQKRR